VHPANIQDRDGGVLVLGTLFGKFPFLKKLFADGGYQGPIFKQACKKVLPHVEIETVKRSDTAVGFEVIPRRWVVERTLAWHRSMPSPRQRCGKSHQNRPRVSDVSFYSFDVKKALFENINLPDGLLQK